MSASLTHLRSIHILGLLFTIALSIIHVARHFLSPSAIRGRISPSPPPARLSMHHLSVMLHPTKRENMIFCSQTCLEWNTIGRNAYR